MQLLDKKFELSTGTVGKRVLKELLQQIDIFWFRLGYQLNETVVDEATRCRFFVTPVTGIDHIDEILCGKLGISIICLRGETEFLKEVRATAEHTLLLAMLLLRRAIPAVKDAHAGNWRRDLFRGHELQYKKVGIIGYGRLGQIVADYFHTFGCEVGFYDTAEKDHPEHIRQFYNPEECITVCDIISLHIPFNKNNHHFFDKELLDLFTADKWLINTSRGGVVNEVALLNCFKQNQIAGAALDVLHGEPEVANHPLIEYARANPNLIITPHIGGCTYESFEKTETFIAKKLLYTLRDFPLQVDS